MKKYLEAPDIYMMLSLANQAIVICHKMTKSSSLPRANKKLEKGHHDLEWPWDSGICYSK